MAVMRFAELVESLRGCGRVTTASGMSLISPDPADGRIDIHERVAIQPVADLIADFARREWNAVEPPTIGKGVLFSTLEGEHAVAIPARVVKARGEVEEHALAYVLADEFAVLIDGYGAPERAELLCRRVRAIGEYYFLALGDGRRRRYDYDAPTGWLPEPRAHSVCWFHPEYMRSGAMLQVFDARSAEVSAPEVEDRILFVDNVSFRRSEPANPPQPFQTPTGIVGQIVRSEGDRNGVPIGLLDVWLTDGRYGYSIQLEARRDRLDALIPVLSGVVDSVRKVPVARLKSSNLSLIHWAE